MYKPKPSALPKGMKQNGFLCKRCVATYSRDRIKGFVVRRCNEYVVIAGLLLFACLTHFGVAYAGTTDPTPSQLIGAAPPAHPTGASAVVRQFYAWYMKILKDNKERGDYLAPVKGLFDDRLYWLLKQENTDHPGSKYRGIACSLDEDPFGSGQIGRIWSFTVGASIARGSALVVPVTLFVGFTSPGGPDKITAIVKDEAGAYKIYDIKDLPHFNGWGIRQGLEGFARDPNCAWSKSGRG